MNNSVMVVVVGLILAVCVVLAVLYARLKRKFIVLSNLMHIGMYTSIQSPSNHVINRHKCIVNCIVHSLFIVNKNQCQKRDDVRKTENGPTTPETQSDVTRSDSVEMCPMQQNNHNENKAEPKSGSTQGAAADFIKHYLIKYQPYSMCICTYGAVINFIFYIVTCRTVTWEPI